VLALQVYDLLNALEDRLGVNNSAVVLATIKVCGSTQQHCVLVHAMIDVASGLHVLPHKSRVPANDPEEGP
jgi:hypothetical protein